MKNVFICASVVALVLIILLCVIKNNSLDSDIDNNVKKIGLRTDDIESMTIMCSLGKEKNVAVDEYEYIFDSINSFDIESMESEIYYGVGQIIIIKYNDKKETIIRILDNKFAVDDQYYSIKENDMSEKIKTIYENLSSPEIMS